MTRNMVGRIKRAFRRRQENARRRFEGLGAIFALEDDVIEAAKRWSAADNGLTQSPYDGLVRREYSNASYGLHAAVDRLDARTSQIS